MRDLAARHHLDLRGRRVFMLGAGSAARGVAPALLDAGIARMVVVNRTPERAEALADAMGEPARAVVRDGDTSARHCKGHGRGNALLERAGATAPDIRGRLHEASTQAPVLADGRMRSPARRHDAAARAAS